jgi:ribokinase
MPKPIVVVGSINLDLVVAADQLPAPGATVFGNTFNTFFGGKGANQAVAVAKLGYPVIMIGNVGSDSFGAQLIEGLKSSGVDVTRVERVAGASGVAVITIDEHGENAIVVVPGANATLSSSQLDKYRAVLRGAGAILTQLEIPFETTRYLAELAGKFDIPLILDPAPVQALPESLLKNLTWITPNETEARLLLSADGQPKSDEQTAQTLLDAGVRNVILKLGARGALVAERNSTMACVPGFKVAAVDTTAAGDAFNGAFAVAILRGMKPLEAARFANAVAAISVTRHGAQPSMPSSEEVEQFLKNQFPA